MKVHCCWCYSVAVFWQSKFLLLCIPGVGARISAQKQVAASLVRERQQRDTKAAAALEPPTPSKKSGHAVNCQRGRQRVKLRQEIDDLKRQLRVTIPQAIDAKEKELRSLTIRRRKPNTAEPVYALFKAACDARDGNSTPPPVARTNSGVSGLADGSPSTVFSASSPNGPPKRQRATQLRAPRSRKSPTSRSSTSSPAAL